MIAGYAGGAGTSSSFGFLVGVGLRGGGGEGGFTAEAMFDAEEQCEERDEEGGAGDEGQPASGADGLLAGRGGRGGLFGRRQRSIPDEKECGYGEQRASVQNPGVIELVGGKIKDGGEDVSAELERRLAQRRGEEGAGVRHRQ